MNALCAMVCPPHRRKARQFLEGLSSGEMEYIADFLGACILEADHPCNWSRTRLAQEIERFDRSRQRRSADRAHKMVLLFEYVCRSVPAPVAVAVRAAQR